ncbi:MAG: hypothetical protein ACYSWQ_05110 [Planctomycetota bacterium]
MTHEINGQLMPGFSGQYRTNPTRQVIPLRAPFRIRLDQGSDV